MELFILKQTQFQNEKGFLLKLHLLIIQEYTLGRNHLNVTDVLQVLHK